MYEGYIDLSVLPAYVPVAVVICAAPGPDMAYMVATGIGAGRRAATRAALGASLGVITYTAIVAAGLGPLVAAHPAVLIGLQVFGALYLARLACITLKDSRQPGGSGDATEAGTNPFRRGLTVNLANPKVGLFFAALLPQFLGSAGSPFLQLMMLGVVFQFFGLVSDITAGWTAAALRAKVLARPRAMRAMALVSGGVLTLLAVLVGTDAVRSLTSL